MCHSVHPEKSASHNTAAHARVRCVECHMGRNSTLKLIAMKPTHFKELWGMIVGYERPLHASATLRPARETARAATGRGRSTTTASRSRSATQPIRRAARIDYALTLHTGRRCRARDPGSQGHPLAHRKRCRVQDVRDAQEREIPWVQVTGPRRQGDLCDPTSKTPREELAKLESRRMECFNCHNAVGHPFPNPADRVDEALVRGPDRPQPASAKSRAVALIMRPATSAVRRRSGLQPSTS